MLRRITLGGNETVSDGRFHPTSPTYNVVMLLGILGVLAALALISCRYWYIHYQIYKATSSTTKELPPPANFSSLFFAEIESFLRTLGYDAPVEREETLHLLSNASIYEIKGGDYAITQENKSRGRFSRSSNKKSVYFRGVNSRDGNDTMLILAFTSVMSIGLFLDLHTSYGKRTVCVTMVGDEIRWQAVKQHSSKIKRYKLHLSDVMSVEIGKQSGHKPPQEKNGLWDRGLPKPVIDVYDIEFDNICFSLVTQKTSLYLEAASKLDRDSLIRGFQLRLESLRS